MISSAMMSVVGQRRLVAEWEPQDAVLMAWPHEETDWAEALDAVEPVFGAIAQAIAARQGLVVVGPDASMVRERLAHYGVDLARTWIIEAPTDDTWARDFGPLTVEEHERGRRIIDARFNAWGGKFPAELDDAINDALRAAGVFGRAPYQRLDFVVEGGALESDGRGALMMNLRCVVDPNRNDELLRADIEERLTRVFGAERLLWVDDVQLDGDDTDGHIDTLARFADAQTIVYMQCDDPADPSVRLFEGLEDTLRRFRTPEGAPYRLLPLPWPARVQVGEDPDGPLWCTPSYANFLIVNGAILAPTYGDPRDAEALDVLAEAFPGREIVGIDCRALLPQGGSLHCLTMQLPAGVVGPDAPWKRG